MKSMKLPYACDLCKIEYKVDDVILAIVGMKISFHMKCFYARFMS